MTEPDPAQPPATRPGDRAKAFYSERLGFHVDVDVRPADGVFYASFADPDGNT